ncbi:MAG: class I SAM-dependent methyltransferase [Flavobacteriaceae bacterium]
MKYKIRITLLLICFLGINLEAQTTLSIEERNELIRERWNRSLVDDTSYTFNKEANNLLTQTTEALKPGKALCVAMGQGRNALFLARNGWEVTGIDLADKAVAYAEKQAREEKLQLSTEIQNFETFEYGKSQWDLITWLYGGCLHVDGITNKIKTALKPGGLFVFEFFHREAGIEMGRPQFGCEANRIRDMFLAEGGFDILLYEEKEGIADYGMDQNKLIYMVLSKK